MKLAIDINGVLRDTHLKFQQVYEKYLIDEMDEESEFEYEMTLPITSLNLMEHFKFKDEDEFLSFMYEEFVMQIFGHAPSVEISTFYDLDELYQKYKEQISFVLISDEISKSKPATLFFLSKFACQIDKIVFTNKFNKENVWDEFDILVTSNPNMLDKNKNKTLIKYAKEYNKDTECELTISNLKELDIILENTLKNA